MLGAFQFTTIELHDTSVELSIKSYYKEQVDNDNTLIKSGDFVVSIRVIISSLIGSNFTDLSILLNLSIEIDNLDPLSSAYKSICKENISITLNGTLKTLIFSMIFKVT